MRPPQQLFNSMSLLTGYRSPKSILHGYRRLLTNPKAVSPFISCRSFSSNNNNVSPPPSTSSSPDDSKSLKKRSWIAQKIADYGDLSKFRLSSLVVLTTGAGFICAGSPIA